MTTQFHNSNAGRFERVASFSTAGVSRGWAFAACLIAMSVAACSAGTIEASDILRINGSTTVNLVAAEAAEQLRAEHGMTILVDTQGGSSGGISMLGERRVEIGMSSKSLTDTDRAKYPEVDFVEHRIGEDAVALVVSADVWEGGVQSLSRDEMQAIYEGRVTNWSEVGGPDRRIAFFNKEPGRGTWEVFAKWLYGSSKKAPSASFPEVGGNEETRNKVGSTQGALSQLSYSWADRERVFPLGLEKASEMIAPSAASIASGSYPMSRPLFLLTDGPPTANAKLFVEFVLSSRGQELVRKQGYLALDELAR